MDKTRQNIFLSLTRFYLLASIVLVATVFTFLCSTQAVAVPVDAITKTKGLTLSPLRSELALAPGTSLEGVLTVSNSTKAPMVVRLSVETFSVINQQYDYAFTAETDVTKWVTFVPEEVNLAPGESQQVTFTIAVPLTAEPGGRYISLFASTDTKTGDGSVNSRQRIASLVYVTVTGDVSRIGRLLSLTSPWVIASESKWTTALQNSGTTHFRSRYNVVVQNIFSNQSVARTDGDTLILPGSVRAVSDTLPVPKLPGLYKAVYTIGLGDTPATVETRFVLYLPPVAVAAVFFILVLVSIVLLRKKKSAKR